MSYEATRLNQVFGQFATFGSGSQLSLNAEEIRMDNAKFAKFCRDTNIAGKSLTITDVDIVFKKVLAKGERKITFDQFKAALRLLAEKKFPNDSQCFSRILELVRKAAPATNSTTATNVDGIYSKLTDTSLYTGSHKERFDENGKGRGLAGRETISSTSDLSKIVARTSGNTKRAVTHSMEQLSKQETSRPGVQSNKKLNSSKKNLNESKVSLSGKSESVYDRLTDHTAYTGTHKHRFDKSTGKGRGIYGRETGAIGTGTVQTYRGGNVHSLSQILRN